MTRKIWVIYFFIVPVIFSCVYTEAVFDSRVFFVKTPVGLEIVMNRGGHLEKINTLEDFVIYKLTFNQVMGGSTYIFGIHKIKESSGYKARRMHIYKNDELLRGYSIIDLDSMLAELDSSDQVIELLE